MLENALLFVEKMSWLGFGRSGKSGASGRPPANSSGTEMGSMGAPAASAAAAAPTPLAARGGTGGGADVIGALRSASVPQIIEYTSELAGRLNDLHGPGSADPGGAAASLTAPPSGAGAGGFLYGLTSALGGGPSSAVAPSLPSSSAAALAALARPSAAGAGASMFRPLGSVAEDNENAESVISELTNVNSREGTPLPRSSLAQPPATPSIFRPGSSNGRGSAFSPAEQRPVPNNGRTASEGGESKLVAAVRALNKAEAGPPLTRQSSAPAIIPGSNAGRAAMASAAPRSPSAGNARRRSVSQETTKRIIASTKAASAPSSKAVNPFVSLNAARRQRAGVPPASPTINSNQEGGARRRRATKKHRRAAHRQTQSRSHH